MFLLLLAHVTDILSILLPYQLFNPYLMTIVYTRNSCYNFKDIGIKHLQYMK